ncbi:hypothetical protein [Rhodohalobacter sp. 8-1]|uniref:hypothetical protein n=1 Tax=Rhodohalobacter sp. 8-1 TaxID=3131972 RepID=UPI0030EC38EA
MWLFNPFLFVGGERILFIGLIIAAVHIPIGYYLDIRFAGAIDMHLVPIVTSWATPVADILIAWVSMAGCMFAAAKLFRSPIRVIDITGSVAVARIPLLISIGPALLLEPDVQSIEELLNLQGSELYQLAALSVISMLFLIWYFVLLYNAFKINSNLKGARLWIGFIGSVIIAEIVSIMIQRAL